ncbi:MAG: tetratricopeptide repeat protein [Planctomycetaceae bacterium]|nr:tetratricopeptide repeat protein [Planctomycetaceae bacterium]
MPDAPQPPFIARSTDLVIGTGASALIAAVLAQAFLRTFVWSDLAVVHVAGCWLGAMLTRSELERATLRWRVPGIGLLCAATGATLHALTSTDFVRGVCERTLLAFGLTLCSQWLVDVWRPHCRLRLLRWTWGTTTLAVVAATVVPAMYAHQRTSDQIVRVGECLDRQRLGTAAEMARELLLIRPEATFQGTSLARIERNLQKTLVAARRQIRELAGHSEPENVLERATLLAICSKSHAAESLVKTLLDDPDRGIDAAQLLGALLEDRGDWDASRAWYDRARMALRGRRDRSEDVVRALNGIAYAARKRGNRPAAESAYREAVALAPTAEQHFLLAQFYEDIQRGDSAARSARKAMELDPAHFQTAGEKLLDTLQVHHTSCLGVYRTRRASGNNGRTPSVER